MSDANTESGRHINGFRYIQNIGRFETIRGSADTTLRPLSLIYSENGRGKTTLCAILRSLTGGDPTPILERRRLSATSEPKAVLDIAGATVSFDGTRWSARGPGIAIFDDHFVDANVHSGLNIDAGHRKGVHELVVGEQGVRLQRQVEGLNSKISLLHAELRATERKVPASAIGSLSVDEFCALRSVEKIEQEIEGAKQSLSVLRDADTIRSADEFRPFALPSFDEDKFSELLGATLADVESAALEAVTRHLSELGAGSEDWISRAWIISAIRRNALSAEKASPGRCSSATTVRTSPSPTRLTNIGFKSSGADSLRSSAVIAWRLCSACCRKSATSMVSGLATSSCLLLASTWIASPPFGATSVEISSPRWTGRQPRHWSQSHSPRTSATLWLATERSRRRYEA